MPALLKTIGFKRGGAELSKAHSSVLLKMWLSCLKPMVFGEALPNPTLFVILGVWASQECRCGSASLKTSGFKQGKQRCYWERAMGAGCWRWVVLGAVIISTTRLFDPFCALGKIQCGAPKTDRLVHTRFTTRQEVGPTGNISISLYIYIDR